MRESKSMWKEKLSLKKLKENWLEKKQVAVILKIWNGIPDETVFNIDKWQKHGYSQKNTYAGLKIYKTKNKFIK